MAFDATTPDGGGELYLDGKRAGRVFAPVQVAGNDPKIADTVAASGLAHTVFVAKRVRLRWSTAGNTVANYRVEKYDSVNLQWNKVGEVNEDGRQVYGVETVPDDDAADAQYRVVSVSATGVEATLAATTVTVVRNGDPVDVTFGAVTGGAVTIS